MQELSVLFKKRDSLRQLIECGYDLKPELEKVEVEIEKSVLNARFIKEMEG